MLAIFRASMGSVLTSASDIIVPRIITALANFIELVRWQTAEKLTFSSTDIGNISKTVRA